MSGREWRSSDTSRRFRRRTWSVMPYFIALWWVAYSCILWFYRVTGTRGLSSWRAAAFQGLACRAGAIFFRASRVLVMGGRQA